MGKNNGTLIKIGATIVSTLIAVFLFYYTFIDRHDAGVRAGTSIEARVSAIEGRHEHMQTDIREIREWVQDLHTVLVRKEPVPIRESSP